MKLRGRRRSKAAGEKTTASKRALFEAAAGLARLNELARRGELRRGHKGVVVPFKPDIELHPPAVMKIAQDKKLAMAMDDALTTVSDWAQREFAKGLFSASHEGMAFLGYPQLAVLAQRPEYRVVSETLAKEMTRKWIRFASKKEDKDQTARIAQLTDFLNAEHLDAEGMFRRLLVQDGFFGRSHLYIDTGDTEDRYELLKPLGESDAKINPENPVQRLSTVEAVWTYPTTYNSTDPLREDWYKPSTWFVMGKQIHQSRFYTYIGHEVPDMLKPAYSFGGLSMTQMLKPYVDNWLRTRQSVADIISAFSVFVLKTDLMESLQQGGEQLFNRAELFNLMRDNAGVMMVDMDTEDFVNVSASLATLDVLQAQTQEHMAAVARIPIVKLLGIQPAGLNADSEGIMRSFYDSIAADQKKLDRMLSAVIRLAHLSLWGKIDPGITYEWEPLHELNEKEQAEVEKTRAETGDILIGNGTLWNEEERRRIAADPATRYAGLDVEDVPRGQEEDPEPGEIHERVEAEGATPDKPDEDREGAAADSVVPFGVDEALELALDEAGFEESKHPRDPEGKFTHVATKGSKSLIHENLKAGGFQPAGKSGAGKPMYKNPATGHTVVIEPPDTAGQKYSSKWTLYEKPFTGQVGGGSKPEETHKGEGTKALKAKLQQLGAPTAPKLELPKSTQVVAPPSKPASSMPELIEKYGLKGGPEVEGSGEFWETKSGKSIMFDPDSDLWVYDPDGPAEKSGHGMADLEAAMKANNETAKKKEPSAKWNSTASKMSQLGYTLSKTTDKTQTYQTSKGTIEIDPETETWLAISAGHMTKQGSGIGALEKLMAGEPPGEQGSWSNVSKTELYPAAKPAPPVHPETALHKKLVSVAPKPDGSQAHALGTYGGSGYKHINESLRQAGGKIPAGVKALTEQLDSYLGNSIFPEDVTLYRKVDGSYAQVLKSIAVEGMVFTDHGYSSTSTHHDSWSGSVKMVISVPKGAKGAAISPYTGHQSENEVLLPRGARFKVQKLDFDGGRIDVQLEV